MRLVSRAFTWMVLALVPALVLAPGPGQADTGKANHPAGSWSLTILHVNDTHSHLEPTPQTVVLDLDPGPERQTAKVQLDLGGFPELLTKIEAIRSTRPRTLLLHGGDAIQGSLYFAAYQGVADFDFLNLLGFDAMTVGNHEFDRGPRFLGALIDRARFPVLGANVDASEEPALAGKIKPYVITRVGGREVALVGLVTPETKEIASPGDKVRFRPVREALEEVLAQLKERSVTEVVLLSHQGYEEDLLLAREVQGVDVIVGGHSHTLLGDYADLGLNPAGPYPSLIKDPAGNTVCVVQAWSWGRLLGQLEVEFNGQGQVLSCSGNPALVTDGQWTPPAVSSKDPKAAGDPQPDQGAVREALARTPGLEVVAPEPGAEEQLKGLAENINQFKNQPVAEAARDLPHGRYPGTARVDDPASTWMHAFPMNQICADSILWAAQNQGWGRVDFAYVNNGGVRQGLKAGPITAGNLYDTFFFDNTLVILDIGGREILADFEHGVNSAAGQPGQPQGSGGGFPTLSGARFSVDMNRPVGRRITSLEVVDAQGKWAPVDPDRTYRIATTSYTAGGGEGYFHSKEANGFRRDTGVIGYLNLIEYARRLKVLVPPEENSLVGFIPRRD